MVRFINRGGISNHREFDFRYVAACRFIHLMIAGQIALWHGHMSHEIGMGGLRCLNNEVQYIYRSKMIQSKCLFS